MQYAVVRSPAIATTPAGAPSTRQISLVRGQGVAARPLPARLARRRRPHDAVAALICTARTLVRTVEVISMPPKTLRHACQAPHVVADGLPPCSEIAPRPPARVPVSLPRAGAHHVQQVAARDGPRAPGDDAPPRTSGRSPPQPRPSRTPGRSGPRKRPLPSLAPPSAAPPPEGAVGPAAGTITPSAGTVRERVGPGLC